MIQSLTIDGFRGLRHVQVPQLAPANLFVGRNNSGKTSLLEAVDILTARDPIESIVDAAVRRGELLLSENMDSPRSRADVDIAHTFFGRELDPESSFRVSSEAGGRFVDVKIERGPVPMPSVRPDSAVEFEDEERQSDLVLTCIRPDLAARVQVRLSRQLGIGQWKYTSGRLRFERAPNVFVTAANLSDDVLHRLWELTVLSPKEDVVIKAVRLLVPDLERLALLTQSRFDVRFVARLRYRTVRVPIGNFGDGVRRILALTLALVQSDNGVLLIDEIDTGLHWSVMKDVWRVMLTTSQELNVQLFATTHSQDYIQGLADLYSESPELADRVMVHRLEAGREEATSYTAREIADASQSRIEVK